LDVLAVVDRKWSSVEILTGVDRSWSPVDVWAEADGRWSAVYVLAEVNRKWLAVEVLAGITAISAKNSTPTTFPQLQPGPPKLTSSCQLQPRRSPSINSSQEHTMFCLGWS